MYNIFSVRGHSALLMLFVYKGLQELFSKGLQTLAQIGCNLNRMGSKGVNHLYPSQTLIAILSKNITGSSQRTQWNSVRMSSCNADSVHYSLTHFQKDGSFGKPHGLDF